MKLDVLAIGAHPDDVEIGCGGTIAKYVASGKKVGILDLTQGELGTRGNAQIRLKEANDAANILGISIRENIELKDGFFENDEKSILEIVKIIRKYRPEILLTNPKEDRHPDHGKGAKIAYDAYFLSGLIKVQTQIDNKPQQAWRPKKIFNYILWNEDIPDFVIDISNFMDKKIEVCKAYVSQFYNPNSNEPETNIASKTFERSIKYRAENLGRLSNVSYAEGFQVNSLMCFEDFESFI